MIRVDSALVPLNRPIARNGLALPHSHWSAVRGSYLLVGAEPVVRLRACIVEQAHDDAVLQHAREDESGPRAADEKLSRQHEIARDDQREAQNERGIRLAPCARSASHPLSRRTAPRDRQRWRAQGRPPEADATDAPRPRARRSRASAMSASPPPHETRADKSRGRRWRRSSRARSAPHTRASPSAAGDRSPIRSRPARLIRGATARIVSTMTNAVAAACSAATSQRLARAPP